MEMTKAVVVTGSLPDSSGFLTHLAVLMMTLSELSSLRVCLRSNFDMTSFCSSWHQGRNASD